MRAWCTASESPATTAPPATRTPSAPPAAGRARRSVGGTRTHSTCHRPVARREPADAAGAASPAAPANALSGQRPDLGGAGEHGHHRRDDRVGRRDGGGEGDDAPPPGDLRRATGPQGGGVDRAAREGGQAQRHEAEVTAGEGQPGVVTHQPHLQRTPHRRRGARPGVGGRRPADEHQHHDREHAEPGGLQGGEGAGDSHRPGGRPGGRAPRRARARRAGDEIGHRPPWSRLRRALPGTTGGLGVSRAGTRDRVQPGGRSAGHHW